MSRKSWGRRVNDGVLAGHYRKGRTYRPPILAYEAALSDWVRDDLPDLVWPLLLVHQSGDDGALAMRRVQQLVLESVGNDVLGDRGVRFDGRLTSLEAVPQDLRAAFLAIRDTEALRPAFTDAVAGVVALYEDAPGAWLLGPTDVIDLDPGAAATELGGAILNVLGDGHADALVKAAPLGWALMAGTLHLPDQLVDELTAYPLDAELRPKTDAFIRSAFLATAGVAQELDEGRRPAVLDWASRFWRQNWEQSPCSPEEAVDREDLAPPADQGAVEQVGSEADVDEQGAVPTWGDDPENAEAPRSDLDAVSDVAAESTIAALQHFISQVTDPDLTDADLHSPARFEVLTGLALRAGRTVVGILRAPHLWSGEHGSGVVRLLVETEITMTWMSLQDRSIFEQFQDFGDGKAKLMRHHAEAMAQSFIGGPPDFVERMLDNMRKKTGGDRGEAFQEVRIDATFAGKSVREMADEAGLLDLYNWLYQSTSGVTHGEWWALDDYVMQRCLNPLHRFHRLPSTRLWSPINVRFPEVLEAHLTTIFDLAVEELSAASQN